MMLNPDGAVALPDRPTALPSESVIVETRFGWLSRAVARMSTEQTFLEASYMLTARLSQLNLANFLR